MEIAELSRFKAAQREGNRAWRFRIDAYLSRIRAGFHYDRIVLDIRRVRP